MNITLHDISVFLLGMAIAGVILCINEYKEEKKIEELRRNLNFYHNVKKGKFDGH